MPTCEGCTIYGVDYVTADSTSGLEQFAAHQAREHPVCTCPHIRVGHEVWPTTAWSDQCGVHGVGTLYFRSLKKLPYGFAAERYTSREEWLEFLRSDPGDDR
jgi:hypothetical protein